MDVNTRHTSPPCCDHHPITELLTDHSVVIISCHILCSPLSLSLSLFLCLQRAAYTGWCLQRAVRPCIYPNISLVLAWPQCCQASSAGGLASLQPAPLTGTQAAPAMIHTGQKKVVIQNCHFLSSSFMFYIIIVKFTKLCRNEM